MALRAPSRLGFFKDVPFEEVRNVPKILAVSEHAILWRQKSPIGVKSAQFPAIARRLLRKDLLSHARFPWLATSTSDRYSCRLFLTPLAPMTSRQLAHHAICVLPVPVPKEDGCISTAMFATATRLFVPIGYRSFIAIVSFASSSPLFDNDVTYEVSTHIHFMGGIPSHVSLTIEPGALCDPDHICLLSYENWLGLNTYKKCSFRYVASRITGEVLSSECVMEHQVEFREMLRHRCDATKEIAGMAGRRFPYDELDILRSKRFYPQQENRIFEPVKLFSNDASSKKFTLMLHAGGPAVTLFDLKRGSTKKKNLLKDCVSAASSRGGRVVVRFVNTVFTGFIGGALPCLEEASRAACQALLSEEQMLSLIGARAFDFSSFLQFCDSFERLKDERSTCAFRHSSKRPKEKRRACAIMR